MSDLENNKSILGKLLATENIRIEHQPVEGPYFDVVTRTLTLPIWKNVDADLYDLMIGHEVGHALYTPKDGWMKKVKELGHTFKGILNIVEDARIEKKMKRKFPGLRRPMFNGYSQLLDRGFFGVEVENMKHLSFVDRINVYFKLGARSQVTFTAEEQLVVDRIENCETWEDVMQIAEELFAKNQKELETPSDDLPENMDMEALAQAILNGDFDTKENADGQGNGNGQGISIEDIINQLREEGKDELADKLEKMMQDRKFAKQVMDWAHNNGAPVTVEALEKNQSILVDTKAYPAKYAFMPRLKAEHWVIPSKVVHNQLRREFYPNFKAKGESIYSEFMANNRKYVNYLVKEFELRKNAKQFAKARVSKTGKLDMKKIWRHTLSDDLFVQSTIVPDGKNHGMIMVVDLSSSMYSNLSGTLEQIVNLALFCRKVNIPFEVYGFSDTHAGYHEYKMAGINVDEYKRDNSRNDNRTGNLQITNNAFRMKQFLHSGMKTVEFREAIKHLLMLATAFRSGSHWSNQNVPTSMQLGGTPLNEAVIVLTAIAERFKQNTKVEVLNTIMLTDGDASHHPAMLGKDGRLDYISSYRNRAVIEDRATKIQTNNDKSVTLALLEMYRQTTGSRVIGFYVMGGNYNRGDISSMASRYGDPKFNVAEEYDRTFKKHRYVGMPMYGYDIFYMVPGDELEIENVEMADILKDKEQNKKNLLHAFKKMQNTKMISRVFLNKFIEHVS